MRWVAGVLLVALASPAGRSMAHAQAPPPGASAEPAPRPGDRAEARRLFLLGQERFQAGQVELAIQAFRRGHELDPRPEFLLNLAQSYRALGRRAEAIRHLEAFVAAAPTHPLRAAADQTLTELRRAEVEAQAPRPTSAPTRPGPPRPAAASPLVPPAPTPPRRSRAWIWGAAGAVLAVAGGVLLFVATRDQGDDVIDTVVVP